MVCKRVKKTSNSLTSLAREGYMLRHMVRKPAKEERNKMVRTAEKRKQYPKKTTLVNPRIANVYCFTSSIFFLVCSLPLFRYASSTSHASLTILSSKLTAATPILMTPLLYCVFVYSSCQASWT